MEVTEHTNIFCSKTLNDTGKKGGSNPARFIFNPLMFHPNWVKGAVHPNQIKKYFLSGVFLSLAALIFSRDIPEGQNMKKQMFALDFMLKFSSRFLQKTLRYAKWCKSWTENQWQHILSRDESSPEPGPQHYWSCVGSSWQRTEQKAAKIQRRAFKYPLKAWRTIPEDYLKKWQKACLRGFRLCWRIKVLRPNTDLEAHANCRCFMYFTGTSFNKSLHHFPVGSLQRNEEWLKTRPLYETVLWQWHQLRVSVNIALFSVQTVACQHMRKWMVLSLLTW